MVIRVLDKTTSLMPLSELGFLPAALAQYQATLRMPHGLTLVSGPTGSGKTTKLVARAESKGRVLAVEVMLGTYAVRNLIREGRTHQLRSAMQLGKHLGMQTLDQALPQHSPRGVTTGQAPLARATTRSNWPKGSKAAAGS